MLKQKLIALAGAVGILACGACFGPGEYRPPPPPPLVKERIRALRVVVTDGSAERHLDADALEALVVRQMNALAGADGLRAYPHDQQAEKVDAVLQIRLTAGSARVRRPAAEGKPAEWVVHVGVAEELMRADGSEVWRQTVPDIPLDASLASGKQEDVWNDHGVLGGLAYRLARQALEMNPRRAMR